jgi:hypothetical protein
MSKVVHIIFNDAGGGHRATAEALAAALHEERPSLRVELLNPIADLPNRIDLLHRLTGVTTDRFYSRLVGLHSLEFLCEPLFAVIGHNIRSRARDLEDLFAGYFSREPADLVVSVIPWLNREMLRGLRRHHPRAPFVTVMTDLEEFREGFWMCGEGQHVVCPTERAAKQALDAGLPPSHVLRASGIPVHPRHYDAAPANRAEELERLGLDPSVPVALLTFGAYPSSAMLAAARSLGRCRRDVQAIFVCGHGREMAGALARARLGYRHAIVGYTDRMPLYYALADFFVGKPGGLSVSEALAHGLPMVLTRPSARGLPHERYNAQWVEEQGFGRTVEEAARIGAAVDALLEPSAWRACGERVSNHVNRAVFETTDLVGRLLGGRPETRHADNGHSL